MKLLFIALLISSLAYGQKDGAPILHSGQGKDSLKVKQSIQTKADSVQQQQIYEWTVNAINFVTTDMKTLLRKNQAISDNQLTSILIGIEEYLKQKSVQLQKK